MNKIKKLNPFKWIILALMTLTASTLSVSLFAGSKHHPFPHNPVIFVHGGAGSASQFESQAMRFTSNGYPQDYLYALEYDSSFSVNTMADVHARLDALIIEAKEKTGAEQIDLMGHSLGTRVSQEFLASPERAAQVAHFVNIDGYPAAAPPGGVPTLAIWAEVSISDRGTIVGAENIQIENQSHVEVATSAESFALMYKFLTGSEANTSDILLSRSNRIQIAGRAVYFPQNTGVADSKVEVYQVRGFDGQRVKRRPVAQFNIDETGEWGPFKAKRGHQYEFVIVRDGQNHHVYKEPFIRDDYFVRLQTSPLGAGVGANMDVNPQQTNLVISRDKEFWGDVAVDNDILAINGVNTVNAANSPLSNRTTAIYLFDAGSDKQSQLAEPLAYFHGLPFITGSDLYIPASPEATGRVRLTMIPRGENGLMQVINIPDWPSDTDRVTVLFNDFVQWDNVPAAMPMWIR